MPTFVRPKFVVAPNTNSLNINILPPIDRQTNSTSFFSQFLISTLAICAASAHFARLKVNLPGLFARLTTQNFSPGRQKLSSVLLVDVYAALSDIVIEQIEESGPHFLIEKGVKILKSNYFPKIVHGNMVKIYIITLKLLIISPRHNKNIPFYHNVSQFSILLHK